MPFRPRPSVLLCCRRRDSMLVAYHCSQNNENGDNLLLLCDVMSCLSVCLWLLCCWPAVTLILVCFFVQMKFGIPAFFGSSSNEEEPEPSWTPQDTQRAHLLMQHGLITWDMLSKGDGPRQHGDNNNKLRQVRLCFAEDFSTGWGRSSNDAHIQERFRQSCKTHWTTKPTGPPMSQEEYAEFLTDFQQRYATVFAALGRSPGGALSMPQSMKLLQRRLEFLDRRIASQSFASKRSKEIIAKEKARFESQKALMTRMLDLNDRMIARTEHLMENTKTMPDERLMEDTKIMFDQNCTLLKLLERSNETMKLHTEEEIRDNAEAEALQKERDIYWLMWQELGDRMA